MRPGLEAVGDMAAEAAAAVVHRTPWVEAATLAEAVISAAPTSAVDRVLAVPGLRYLGLRQGRASTSTAHLLPAAAQTGS
jgi:hypothetical protein